MLTRVYGARDLATGIGLNKAMIGKMGVLERHHLFPKRQLHKHGIRTVSEVNALANFTFLTKQTNLQISAKLPENYFPQYEAMHPGVLASHWIPQDPKLWKIENYRDFLAARRELLAKAANDFLDQLLHGALPEAHTTESVFEREARPRPISIASDEEEAALQEAMTWMEAHNLPRGELGYELVDAQNQLLTIIDLAWINGIQQGLTQPVALLIDEDDDTLKVASSRGFTCFTSLPELQTYVQREILGE